MYESRKGAKEPGHLTFSRIRRKAQLVWKRSSSGDGFFFLFRTVKALQLIEMCNVLV